MVGNMLFFGPGVHGNITASFLVLLLSMVPWTVMANCTPRPIELGVGNITLSNQKVVKGIHFLIGEPEQTFAFMPNANSNVSIVFGDDGHCAWGGNENALVSEKWTRDGCITYRGGLYNDSSSSKGNSDTSSLPFDEFPPADLADRYTERFRLEEGAVLDHQPLVVTRNDLKKEGYSPLSELALGKDSSILKSLKSQGKIMSRTWSFFWGNGPGIPVSEQRDGSFIFGGYDKAIPKSDSSPYVYDLRPTPECMSGLVVTVKDMSVKFDGQQDPQTIFPNSSTKLDMCLEPSYPGLMRLQLMPYIQKLLDILKVTIYDMDRSFGWYYYDLKYPGAEVQVFFLLAFPLPLNYPRPDPSLLQFHQKAKLTYNSFVGHLEITLESGLHVTIENKDLVPSEVSTSPTTGDVTVNNTAKLLVVDSLQSSTAGAPPSFGSILLTSMYLMVNYDAGKFTLWEAALGSRASKLVAVDAANNHITNDFCTVETPDNHNISPSSIPVPSIPVGTIAGAVVSGVAAIAVAIFLGYCFWWRRRKGNAAEATATSVQVNGGKQETDEGQKVDDKATGAHPASELDTSRPQSELLTPLPHFPSHNSNRYELDTGVTTG